MREAMAESYMISRRDMLRLVAALQRQSIGVRMDDGRLRVTEERHGTVTVTDVVFTPIRKRAKVKGREIS